MKKQIKKSFQNAIDAINSACDQAFSFGCQVGIDTKNGEQRYWLSLEKFIDLEYVGWCWIIYKGRAKMAYFCECCDRFLRYKGAAECWMTESIEWVIPVFEPEMPKPEQVEGQKAEVDHDNQ